MIHGLKRVTLTGLVAVGLAGCPGDPEPLKIDSSKAAVTISQNTEALADGFAKATTFVGSSESMKALTEECVTTPSTGTEPGKTTCTSEAVDTATPANEGAKWLKEHLFTTARLNAALTNDTTATFCLDATDVCTKDAQVDAKCKSTFEAVPVCVKVQSFVENEFECAVLVGKQQEMNPANVTLKADFIKVQANLLDGKKAVEAFATAAGEQLPEGFPTRLEGKLAWELQKLGEKVLSSKGAVIEAVALDLFPATDARHSEVRIAASPDLFSVKVDADQKKLEASYDLKAVDVLVALNSVYGEDGDVACEPGPCPAPKTYTGQFLAHLDGLSFTGAFDAATVDETFSVQGIGLGGSTSKVQFKDAGTTSDLIKVDLNSSLGRKVDVTVVKSAAGVQVKVAPGLALLVDHDFRALMAQIPDLKGAAKKAISEIKLTGAAPSLFFAEGKSQVKVEGGTLELNATGMLDGLADVHLTTQANQCVLEAATAPAEGAHPFAGVVAGTCQ